ncbi:uncharacterized protein AB675_6064 [Cyphellophora attinorum]|uniref:N-acetyltransferase domain-containing protein n=1 Tax=Cyphellophora attinorum TaxID=1664694 RepID=A0A0N1H6H0_9EURO|nr:uncharacterized protein AB675_6064 [Phialophora attinorum]KPI36946.1 hypothetical protein AB675_6064 [Phialophora attinorum]
MGSLSPPSSDVSVAFYSRDDLRADPTVTKAIFDLINLAFMVHSQTIGFHKKEPRFWNTDEMLEMVGPNGVLAAASINGQLVASSSFVPWRPTPGGNVDQALKRDRPKDYALLEQGGPSYEVKAVVTLQGPTTSRQGLAGVVNEALLKHVDQRHPGQDVLLWIGIAEAQAGPYWRRRGYERVGDIEIKPTGTWGSDHPFEYMTCIKRVDISRSG